MLRAVMIEISVREALADADRKACFAIRIEVFCKEQNISREIEFDGLDDACRHFIALDVDRPVGTARVRSLGDGFAKFERIAVLRSDRGRKAGKILLETAIREAARDGYSQAIMHAQKDAKPFYDKLGFQQEGNGFMEAGIPHIRMARALSSDDDYLFSP
ncbi:MAG: GNAT family N-acetyltransferase [Alphaproteobacteria bacterium]